MWSGHEWKKYFQDFLEGNDLGVKRQLYNLGMASRAVTDLPVGRIGGTASRVA